MGYLTTFLYSQLLVSLPHPTADFTGQTIIVTGSNTGLGLEAARHFLRLNAAKVVLAVRNLSKGAAAAAALSASTDTPTSRIEVWALDLASHDSIKAFAARVSGLDRLDCFVQNAGILTSRWEVVEGMESSVAVNVVGAVLLGLLVLPVLRRSAERWGGRGRLVFVGSDLMYIAKFREKDSGGRLWEALGRREGADMDDRYKVSKLLLLYAVRSIAAQSPISPTSNVVVNYVTPGACKSEIFRDDAGLIQRAVMGAAVAMIARTTEVGSRTILHAAAPDVGEETHGAFLMDCKVAPNGENVDSVMGREMQGKWTNELFERLEQVSPGVTNF